MIDQINDFILRQIFDKSGLCRINSLISHQVVSRSLNSDLYSCTRGMLVMVEGKIIHALARKSLLFDLLQSSITVFTKVSSSYRLMREEAACEHHQVFFKNYSYYSWS